MAQTVANITDALKQVWTSDRLVEQLYQDNPLLETLEKTKRFSIGKEAIVPVHKGRSGGYSAKPDSGGTLNAADEQKVDSASYDFKNHWFQIELEAAAIAKTEGGSSKSVANAVDLEVTGAIDDLRKQLTRQALGNGDGIIAQCTTTTAATEVELLSTGRGYDAIVRGHLYPGLPVQVGTAGDRDADTASSIITAVEEVAATPSITISDAITTDSNDYVGVAGSTNAAGTAVYEMHGLRQIVSTTEALGGLDPQNAGEEFWSAAGVDTSTTTLSLDVMLTQSRKVHQKTGKSPNFVLTSLKQQENFYKLLQSQVRYAGDRGLGAGNDSAVSYAGMTINAQPDVYDRDMFFLTKEDLFLVGVDKPRWVSDIENGGGVHLRWKQGNTAFVDAVYYPLNLAARRRNSHAALTALTA
jgi:hypothetical protein